jgi:Flp pilus assembly protein TadD
MAVELVLVFALLAAYANSLRGPFVFDDVEAIVENGTIRSLGPAVFSPPFADGQTVGGRPLVNVTLALNYAAGGLDPVGYHGVNLAIHLAATLVLFGLVRRTLMLAPVAGLGEAGQPGSATPATAGVPFAAAVALLWGLHPLQTEAVTYVIQRAESLMGLLYLLTLYCFVRGAHGPSFAGPTEGKKRGLWLGLSVGSCFLGMATKEVMVSAPVLVLLYDRAFVSGSLADAWRRRRFYYGALAATWLLLGALVLSTKDRGGSMGLGLGVSFRDYLLTQGPAILHYLRLVAWPQPLIFDYGAVFPENALASLPAVVAVAALAAGTLWLLWKKPVAGFLAGWFFAVLAPTSLVPANRQTISEHRMYLALAPLFVLGAALAVRALGRLPPARRGAVAAAAVGLLAAAWGGLTWQRNTVYQSDFALWSHTAAHRPENPHAHSNLGIALAAAGRTEEARAQFAEAVRLEPRMASFRNNLGSALMTLEKPQEAAEQYRVAVELLPSFTGAWANLGRALTDTGRFTEATTAFDEALQRKQGDWDIRMLRSFALLQGGRTEAAVAELAALARERPEHPGPRINLALALTSLNRLPEAAAQYAELVKLEPGDAQLHNSYGIVLAQLGRLTDARTQFAEAVRLEPGFAGARNNLDRVNGMLRPSGP